MGAVRLGLWSGIGLVVSNMIGAGVFISTGLMAQDMGPRAILLAWVAGTVMALAGTAAYADVARLVPRSGGEYRYLADLWHPALGYLAGWATLLVGFSAPVAIDAMAAAAFAGTLWTVDSPRIVATVVVAGVTALHAIDLRVSKFSQNALVALKAALVIGFVLMGLLAGSHEWPTWTAPRASDGFPLAPFMTSLVFIAFTFSGWNAAVYSASEFTNPSRDVPRSMAIGCAAVSIVYLLVNWVFVANLTPQRAAVVLDYENSRVTLGHLVATDILGPVGASFMSVLAVVALISATSAMTFAGPRVYAAMARDGFLPRWLAGSQGRPPAGSVLLQGAVALGLLWSHELRQILESLGAILVLFAGLTTLSLVRVRWSRPDLARPSRLGLIAAMIYATCAAVLLYFAFRDSWRLLLWIAVVVLVALVAYALQRGLTAPAPQGE